YICDVAGAVALPVPSLSDSIVPCVAVEQIEGPLECRSVLHVLLPNAPGGAVEKNLHLGLSPEFDPRVSGSTLVVAADEAREAAKLDPAGTNDCDTTERGGPFVLHVFNAHTQRTRNFGVTVDS